jgi:hypothetical protein
MGLHNAHFTSKTKPMLKEILFILLFITLVFATMIAAVITNLSF